MASSSSLLYTIGCKERSKKERERLRLSNKVNRKCMSCLFSVVILALVVEGRNILGTGTNCPTH